MHNLKFIFRSLWANKVYSTIIMLSLVVGFVCTNIMVSFLVFETNTDSFHQKSDRTFQLFSDDPFGDKGMIAYIPEYFPAYLTANYPEVENICQLANLDGVSLANAATNFDDLKILLTDTSFFSFFDFPVLKGNPSKALDPGHIILSKEKALALFGSIDVIGSMITVSANDSTKQMIVSAIVDRPFENSHLHFDGLISKVNFVNTSGGGATYVLLKGSVDETKLEQKLAVDVARPGLIGVGKMKYAFEPLTSSYFNTDNKMSFMKTRNPLFVKVGLVVGGLVLFIATFNFVNLFLLSWQNRKKEIGIKKTLGVSWQQLFYLSMMEAGVYVVSAFVLSLFMTFYLIPAFNTIFEADISPAYFSNWSVSTFIIIILFSIGVMAVIFAVSKQWHMKPISLIANDYSKIKFNRFLFTVQFVISIMLAICAVTVVEQMNHLTYAPLGFNRFIIQLNAPDKQLAQNLPALKNKLMHVPGVNTVTLANGNPIFGNTIARYELGSEAFYSPYLFSGDERFFKTLDLKIMEGEMPSETNNGKVVNQQLVRQLDIVNPIGATIPGTKDRIIGVVEDFTVGSFKQEIPPVIISFSKQGQSLLIDYKGRSLSEILPKVEKEWKSVFADQPFRFRMIQDELMKKYKEETFFFNVIVTFSIVIILLSCFGLFALSWAIVQNRRKEMGIRKVLGATPVDIFNLLTLTFTKRMLLAFAIATPMAYYLMNEWLAKFVNKIEPGAWIIFVSGLIIAGVGFITLSIQTLKASFTNPIGEIRND